MLRILTLLLLVTPLCVPAQTYTAGKIVFNHPGDFTQQQLEDVAAIHPGTKFNNESLAVDAQRLADTGFFDNVGVTCEGPLQSLTVNFDITPIDHSRLLPVGFENFIWLTPSELTSAVQSASPLFAGYLPENPALEDSIAAALTQARSSFFEAHY